MKTFERYVSVLLVIAMLLCSFSCAKSDDEESALAGEIVTDTDSESDASDDNSSQNTDSTTTDNKTDKSESETTSQNDNKNNQTNTDNKQDSVIDSEIVGDEGNLGVDDTIVDEYDPYALEEEFKVYKSNTFVPTGNHSVLLSETETTKTFRMVFPVQEYGRLEYCFYFSNCVDSTWGSGDPAYRNMPTDPYEILSASVMVTKSTDATSVSRKSTVTFDNKKTRSVEADEMFWSDPVMYNVAEGEYLVFEWKVKYTMIPCNKINGVGYGYASTNGTSFEKAGEGVPMPSMIGAKRDNAKSVAFIGDSITAGEGAGAFNGYVAQISKGLGKDVSIWNLGLGYARANDAVNSPSWMKKAKGVDTVAICFGVNDINSGAYNVGTRTANQVIEDITWIAKEIAQTGVDVIILTTPPYTYADAERVQKWRDVVTGLKNLAKTNKYQLFDFASYLGTASDPSKPGFGGHPNGEGCTIVAKAFLEKVKNNEIKFK